MTIPTLPEYVFPSKPVPQITPFTYRDGVTMLKKLDGIVRYINRELVPFVNENYSGLADAFEEQVNLLIIAVNDAIDQVINDSIEVQDPVVAALIGDLDSDTSNALDLRYALKSVVDSIQAIIDSGRLSDASLDAAYGAKSDVDQLITDVTALETLTTTGRLSQAELDKNYWRIVTPEQYGAVGNGVVDDSSALNTMLAAITDGTVIKAKPGAIYRHNARLLIDTKVNILWLGGTYKYYNTDVSASGAVTAIRITNSQRIILRGVRVECVTQNQQYNGITAVSSSDIIYDNCYAYNFRWVGLSMDDTVVRGQIINSQSARCRFGAFIKGAVKVIGGRYSSEWSQTQEFIDKGGVWDSTSIYYDGIIVGGDGWLIQNVTLDDNGQSGIYGGGGNVNGAAIGNFVRDNWNKGIDLGVGTEGGTIDGMLIANNIVEGNKTGNIHFKDVIRSIIEGNRIETHAGGDTFGIGLNGTCQSCLIVGNSVRSQATTIAGIFVNSTATGNTIGFNHVSGTVTYSVDGTVNNVMRQSGNSFLYNSLVNIDRSTASGFNGRMMLSLTASADNTYAQIAANKPVRFEDGGGTRLGVEALTFTATSFIKAQQVATASRPTPAAAGAGAMIYDTTLGKPIWSNGSAWRDAAGTAV